MHFNSPTYKNATTIANRLMQLILSTGMEGRDYAALTREWINIEHAKREWRGLPRLAPSSMREMAEAKRQALKNVTAVEPAFTEITANPEESEGKESLSPATVPTPPAPTPP